MVDGRGEPRETPLSGMRAYRSPGQLLAAFLVVVLVAITLAPNYAGARAAAKDAFAGLGAVAIAVAASDASGDLATTAIAERACHGSGQGVEGSCQLDKNIGGSPAGVPSHCARRYSIPQSTQLFGCTGRLLYRPPNLLLL